jgi:hypothetical protein
MTNNWPRSMHMVLCTVLSAAAHLSQCKCAAISLGLLIVLSGCASTSTLPKPSDLPDGAALQHVVLKQTPAGWLVGSGIMQWEDGHTTGHNCGFSHTISISPYVNANLFSVREACTGATLSESETKWIKRFAQIYGDAIARTPALQQFFFDLGPFEFDWYLVQHRVNFVYRAEPVLMVQGAPRISLRMPLPNRDADDEVKQLNATIGFTAFTHEYFHILAKKIGFQFERPSLEEVVAYLLSHASAIELGMDHSPTPNAYLRTSLDDVWSEALVPNNTGYASSIAGLRLAYTMVKKANTCPDPRAATRGTVRVAYEKLRAHRKMSFDDLRAIDRLTCDERQSKGDGGLDWKCDAKTGNCEY